MEQEQDCVTCSYNELLQRLMLNMNERHQAKLEAGGVGYVLPNREVYGFHKRPGGPAQLLEVHARPPVHDLEGLRRFTTALRALVHSTEAEFAAVGVELPLAIAEKGDECPEPTPAVVVYADFKYGGMRVWVAPKADGDLVFRDMGIAHPSANFFPHLIPAEAYNAAADA
jgi:hypothetical protein